MIAIVDYGAGNLVSVKKAIDWLGRECAITSDPAQVRMAERIILHMGTKKGVLVADA